MTLRFQLSSNYLRALTPPHTLTAQQTTQISEALSALEKEWVSSVNAVCDNAYDCDCDGGIDDDVVILSQIVWAGLKLSLQVEDVLKDMFTNGETWELVYSPPFFVSDPVFCRGRPGVKFDLPLLRGEYVIYPTSTATIGPGLAAFYEEFGVLMDAIERREKCREVSLIKEELAARMAA